MVHVNSEHRAAECKILANTEQQDVGCYFCIGGNSVAGYDIKGCQIYVNTGHWMIDTIDAEQLGVRYM